MWYKMLDYVTGIISRYWWKDTASTGTGTSPRDLREFMNDSGMIDHVGLYRFLYFNYTDC